MQPKYEENGEKFTEFVKNYVSP